MKSLLMATDLSARSDRALERAARLAQNHGAALTVVHVVDEDLPAALAEVQRDAAKQAIGQHLETLASVERPGVSVEVVLGRAHAAVLETAERSDAELIVLGVHREDLLKDMFRGTTAERVIRAGDVPVLLVKQRASGPYDRVMVAVDFSVHSRRAVEFALGFAPGGRFHLVHAYATPFKGFLQGQDTRRQAGEQHEARFREMIEVEMAALLSAVGSQAPEVDRIMREGPVRDVIHQELDRLKPDLLVVGTHGRTGVAHAVLGSIAEDLLRNPPCDVLAVNAW